MFFITHICPHSHTYTPHTCMQHTHIYTHTHTRTHTYTHTHNHTNTHAHNTRTHKHNTHAHNTHTLKYTQQAHILINTCTTAKQPYRVRKHARTHTHAQIHTHTHTCIISLVGKDGIASKHFILNNYLGIMIMDYCDNFIYNISKLKNYECFKLK